MERKSLWIALCSAVLFCLKASAQSGPGVLPPQDAESVAQQMAEDGASEDQIEDWLQQAVVRRIDINHASRASLAQSGLFTQFQIASLLEYRAEYGLIISEAELALVDGFSAEKVAALRPFIDICADEMQTSPLQHTFRSRYKFKSSAEGFAQYNRLIVQDSSKELCLLAESDMGEELFIDHFSGSVRLERGRWQFVAGDYLAGFGQGLAIWNGFSFAGVGAPASMLRRSKGITCNHTADESDFLRGAACTYRCGGGALTVFASANGVDANVGENGYTSIVTAGYHRTDSEKAKKNAMHEYLAGADYSHSGAKVMWNVTAVAYTYDERNCRKVQDYNRYQMYDGWHGNVAAGGMLPVGHTRVFAELATDSGFALAAVAGAVYSPSYNFEAALHLRWYDHRYIATHAGSYSSQSAVANQRGAVLSLLYRPGGVLQLGSFSSFVHYPWLRYRVDEPSSDIRQKTRAEWKWERGCASIQHNFSYSTADKVAKNEVKLNGKCPAGPLALDLRSGFVSLASAGGVDESGIAVAGDISYRSVHKTVQLAAGATYYDADSYTSRVYLYESDIPGSFSSHSFYGEGVELRLLMQYKPARWIAISCKVSKGEEWDARLQLDLQL